MYNFNFKSGAIGKRRSSVYRFFKNPKNGAYATKEFLRKGKNYVFLESGAEGYVEAKLGLTGYAGKPNCSYRPISEAVAMAVNYGGVATRGLRSRVKPDLVLQQTLNDYFFAPSFFLKINKNSRWLSMEEIITHFLFYSEGPVLPSGFSLGTVEAPKGHLGVSVISSGGNKLSRVRVRSSIQTMASQLTTLVQGVSLGDFVVIVSGSNIVVGEIDR